jgi:hypothetical protein
MPIPRTKRAAKAKKKVVVVTIEYRCDPENLNLNEALDTLREMGAAEVKDIRVEEGEV